jgi:hypothetical protein
VTPLQCCKCGRFIGPDGYPDIYYDDWTGGYEEGESLCGPCGRAAGKPDKREQKKDSGGA